jgi:hypothetical protein
MYNAEVVHTLGMNRWADNALQLGQITPSRCIVGQITPCRVRRWVHLVEDEL